MVEDSCDHNPFRINEIQNSMTAMNYAPNAVTKIRPLFADQGEIFQSRENLVYSSLIGSGAFVTEPFRTKCINFSQVCTGGFA